MGDGVSSFFVSANLLGDECRSTLTCKNRVIKSRRLRANRHRLFLIMHSSALIRLDGLPVGLGATAILDGRLGNNLSLHFLADLAATRGADTEPFAAGGHAAARGGQENGFLGAGEVLEALGVGLNLTVCRQGVQRQVVLGSLSLGLFAAVVVWLHEHHGALG